SDRALSGPIPVDQAARVSLFGPSRHARRRTARSGSPGGQKRARAPAGRCLRGALLCTHGGARGLGRRGAGGAGREGPHARSSPVPGRGRGPRRPGPRAPWRPDSRAHAAPGFMIRVLGRLLAVAGAGTALYALGRYASVHKIDDKYRLLGAEWGYKLSSGELILYLGCAVAGGFATVLLTRALGPAVGERLGRLLAARRAPLVLAAFAVAATIATGAAFGRAHVYPEESGCELAARALARGRLSVPSPPDPDALDYPFVDDLAGRRFGVCGPLAAALAAAGRSPGRGWG